MTVAILQVAARALEMFSSLGWFIGSLFFDRLSGAADNSSRVRYRAAHLRCFTQPYIVLKSTQLGGRRAGSLMTTS